MITNYCPPSASSLEGGGSAGIDSTTVQAVIDKDAKDWTLDEQEVVAEDIAAKGEASPAYSKTKAAMDAGTTWSIQLTDGSTLTYRIIGIDHDNLTDGSGKAGLTFLTTSTGIESRMNATDTNAGGWEKSELRMKMNSGEIWNLMPADFQSKVKAVRKLTNNVGGGDENNNAVVTATSDRLFPLSNCEIANPAYIGMSEVPWIGKEGTQYEALKGTDIGGYWWERSVSPYSSENFLSVNIYGSPVSSDTATSSFHICPAWCF